MGRANGEKIQINHPAICMKENTKMIKSVDKVLSLGSQATNTVVATKMIVGMGTVKCTGRMVVVIKVNGFQEYRMVME